MVIDPAQYPFPRRFADIAGHRMHYVDEGRGEPVVMVHGNPTWSFYYRGLILALKGHFRAVAPDHIGCGFSDKPGDDRYDYTLARRVEDLETLLDRLDIRENINLVVHDWGGMIGMAFAARHPERIKRIVAMNTAAFPMPPQKTFPPALWLGRNTAMGALLIRGFNAFCRAAARVCCKRRPMPAEIRAAYLAPYDSWANRIAVLRFVQDIPLRRADRAYPLVKETAERLDRFAATPTLLCWGLRDFVFSAEFLEEWRRRLPHARTHVMADVGHYVLEDAPEEVLPRIRDFLLEPA